MTWPIRWYGSFADYATEIARRAERKGDVRDAQQWRDMRWRYLDWNTWHSNAPGDR